MPLIPIPAYEEPELVPKDEPYVVQTHANDDRVRDYLKCANWICHICSSTVFGRCLTCAYCRHKLGKVTDRPIGYEA